MTVIHPAESQSLTGAREHFSNPKHAPNEGEEEGSKGSELLTCFLRLPTRLTLCRVSRANPPRLL